MNSGGPGERAIVAVVAARLMGDLQQHSHPAPDVSTHMQAATRHVFRPTSPVEIYSNHRPTLLSGGNEDYIPICQLLGQYSAQERLITIYHRNIEQVAQSRLSCTSLELATVVRVHEYAHALVHCGVASYDDSALLIETASNPNRWDSLDADRTGWFTHMPSAVHEFLAQSVTWRVLSSLEELHGIDHRDLFLRLMQGQPPEYRLSAEELRVAASPWNCAKAWSPG